MTISPRHVPSVPGAASVAASGLITAILLVIWFVVTYLLGGVFAAALNEFSFLGFPLGYYMAPWGYAQMQVLAHFHQRQIGPAAGTSEAKSQLEPTAVKPASSLPS